MVKHDSNLAPRTQDTKGLVQDAFRIGGVMEDSKAIDEVERAIPKGKTAGVQTSDLAGKPEEVQSPATKLHRMRRQIDTRHVSSVSGELDQVGPLAASDLQDFATSPSLEFSHLGDVRFHEVSMGADLGKKVPGPLDGPAVRRPTRGGVPKGANPIENHFHHCTLTPIVCSMRPQ
jgi:hypothetical protein